MTRLGLALACALFGCASTVEVTRTVTPRDAAAYRSSKLVPVAIARADERIALPADASISAASVRVKGDPTLVSALDAADAVELDERGEIVAARAASGEWTELAPNAAVPPGGAGEAIPLVPGDRIVLRGTLRVGDVLPDGARVVEKRARGFLVFGALMMVFGYLPAVIGGVASKDEKIDRPLLAPFVGPWIAMAQRLQTPCVPDPIISGANCAGPSLALFGYAVSGIAQGLGALFFVVGLPSHAELAQPDGDAKKASGERSGVSVRIVPWALPNGGGIGLSGRF